MTDQRDAPTPGEPPIRDAVDAADADLVLRSRSGDTGAFGELWRRHYRSGITVAHNVSPGTDADDLVQEAYTRIYHSIQRGGGPTGSFRAYLFTSIRNTAAGWGRSRRETPIDELETLEDPTTTEQATADSLDCGLTHQAFRSLPSRWQEVLWYSEIEGMKPAEIAPLLGMKPTAVAQLTFRAREGLREAWIQAHLRTVADDSDCAWAIARLGAFARNNLGGRDRGRLESHLAACARCAIVASEAREVSSRLALVLIPLTVGATGAAGYLASLQGGGAPLTVLAAMPSTVVSGAVTAAAGGGATGGASAAGMAGAAGVGAAGTTAGAGTAAAAGSAVSAAAAGTAAAASTTVAAGATAAVGGTLTGVGVASIATATLVVAGTMMTAVVLPADAAPPGPAPLRTLSQSDPTAAEPVSDMTIPLAPAGPSPADIPVLPREEGPPDPASAADGERTTGGADGRPAHGDGNGKTDRTTGGNGAGGSPAGDSDSANAGEGSASASAGTRAANAGGTGSPGNGNSGGGTGVNGANNGTAQSGNTNSGAGNNNGGGGKELPAGSPSIASSSSTTADGQTTIALVVRAEPGASVQAKVRGIVRATGAVGADGTVTLSVQPRRKDLDLDARLELRCIGGAQSGNPVSARLSTLL